MNRSNSPETGFINPDGDNAEAVQVLVENVLDQLLEQLETAQDRSPLPDDSTIPEDSIPSSPRSQNELLDYLETIVSGSMNPAHPGYIGHMDTIPTTVSVLGDLVTSAVNNNMLSVELSPVFSELEVQLTEAIASEFGLGPNAGGILASGGSLANLHALSVARNHAIDVHQDGLTGLDHKPVLFASEVAHTSLQKAAMMLGLGTEAVVAVETDPNSRMKPTALSRRSKKSIETAIYPSVSLRLLARPRPETSILSLGSVMSRMNTICGFTWMQLMLVPSFCPRLSVDDSMESKPRTRSRSTPRSGVTSPRPARWHFSPTLTFYKRTFGWEHRICAAMMQSPISGN